MARKKWTLGLHTTEEQTQALSLARDAYRSGAEAAQAGEIGTLAYNMGYLAGISDLALREGVTQLAEDVSTLYNQLDDMLKEMTG